MLPRLTVSAVVSVVILVCLTAGRVASPAEFRTSVRGQPLVRRAAYQTPATTFPDAPQLAEPLPEPLAMPGARGALRAERLPAAVNSFGAGASYDYLDDDCAAGCDPVCYGPPPCFTYWSSFEFLLWWRQNQPMPALVTTSPPDTEWDIAGVRGVPTTQVLYPSDEQGGNARPGGRLSLGLWCDPCQVSGFGGQFYWLGDMTANYHADSDLYPILARPFFNLALSREDADLVAYPGRTVGTISVDSNSDVGGGDVFFRRMLVRDDIRRVDLLAGYQFAAIDSSLLITSNRVSVEQGGNIAYGTVIDMYDMFNATNRYHAGEIGLVAEFDHPTVTWSVLAKVGLGNMKQRTTIIGQTAVAVPPSFIPAISSGGLLARSTNMGVYERDQFTVSPEVQLSAAFHLNGCVDLLCGYSFIYWNHVAQASGQIDDVINPSPRLGDPRPAFLDRDSDFFVHGLNFGIQVIW